MSKINSFPISINKIDNVFLNACENIHDIAKTQTTPIILHMLGIPGVGKSTIAKLIHEHILFNNKNISFVAFDSIMSSISSYQQENDKIKAFDKYEIPARNAGYSLLNSLIEMKAHILFDHGGGDDRHPSILEYAKNNGYRIYMLHVKTDIKTAKNRIVKRQEVEGRFTPPEYIDIRQKYINELLPLYKNIADNFFEVHNNKDQDIIEFKENHINKIINMISL